ncbi:hypothetical protein RBJ15_11370 [Pantoea sp. BS_4]|uniref:hypothetical protein n=1 Tax=unclassified Pantoea TaxID=2630326 RepID=UPI0035BFA099
MNTWVISSGDTFVKGYNINMSDQLYADLISRIPGGVISKNIIEFEDKTKYLISDYKVYYFNNIVDETEIRRRVLALLSLQAIRLGRLMLHSCCIKNNNKTIALIGDYGTGKTTFALHMSKLGWEILSGDTSYISSQGKFIAGSRIVLSREPVMPDAVQTTLNFPISNDRWEAGYCHGGPYDDINLDLIVLFDETVINRDTDDVKCDDIYQSCLRVFKVHNSNWCRDLITNDIKSEIMSHCLELSKKIKTIAINKTDIYSIERLINDA